MSEMYILLRKKYRFLISEMTYTENKTIGNRIHLKGTCKELLGDRKTTIVLDDTKKQRSRIVMTF